MRHYANGMFAKRHYETIATLLADLKPAPNSGDDDGYDSFRLHQWKHTVQQFEKTLRRDNDRFDTERFFGACNYVS
jgi:hypothetical protein